ncbi:low molecular weight protein-tyrosine-phosphatase [Paucibacter sp. APW11]|uniref:protein-tyrosine-phosphatase n=1 Tax=Roseateles aquae TaxID=3077235 RepID=A0ABU3PBL0_9BURK|nr:low molecular weight protein-tyrosine-phosphatase [Paucibacter sp. APW11]MDT8999951.1 low molecular weight protein-tyrosine-phosphatase [Paucibacter sp. APW11]
MSSLLLVCTANICRSPMAEVVFTAQARALGLDLVASAGTHAHPRGQVMDPRAQAALAQRRYTPPKRWKSRRVTAEDFERFDRVLAMDEDNLAALRKICPPEAAHKLGMFLDLLPEMQGRPVPDPYFGSALGFENVLTLIERASRALFEARQAAA